MKDKTLISILIVIPILIVILTLISMWFIYFASPTKAEVDRYFEENKCISCSGDYYGEVYQMRRQTAMFGGQIFRVPWWWMPPNFILYTTTPFNYYRDAELVTMGDDGETFHRYTWVDTWDGRLVYDAVTGEYVKEIDDKIDPAKKWIEDLRKQAEELQRLSGKTVNSDYICNYNAYNCADFTTHAEAQMVYEICGGPSSDVHKLDRDMDGFVCETLP